MINSLKILTIEMKWSKKVFIFTTINGTHNIQGGSKLCVHPVKFLTDKDRETGHISRKKK